MISLYTTLYNAESNAFPWRDSLSNWQYFLQGRGEIVIAVNASTDNTLKAVRQFVDEWRPRNVVRSAPVKIIETAVPYEDPEFDGKIKALALAQCTQPFCTLLDADEFLPFNSRPSWIRVVQELDRRTDLDAFFIPTVDLYGDENHYKCEGVSLGQKWYLHKNRPDITRGVVKWAYREDGSVDISKSDSTELINAETRELVRAVPIFNNLPHYIQIEQLARNEIPFVIHTGWLEKKRRTNPDPVWEKHWKDLDRSDVKIAKTEEEMAKVKKYRHRLPEWRVGR